MKKVLFILMALFMTTAFISCSDNDFDEDSSRELDVNSLLNQTEPLYKEYVSIDDLQKTEKTVGDWTFTMRGDYIREVVFGSFDKESDYAKAPASAEAFFEKYLPLTKDNRLVLVDEYTSGGIPQKIYHQYYKGIEAPGMYQCFYQPDEKTLCWMQGRFTPIDDLDVNPRISEEFAKRIALSFITRGKEEFDNYKMNSDLRITSFIQKDRTNVHLVYECTYSTSGWHTVYSAIIDAHTGRVLTYVTLLA